MTFRMALRSFAAQPVRSAVLACGFGMGIACMAGLLGIGEVILEQSRSPHLRGGGDVVLYGSAGRVNSARFVISQLLAAAPLGNRVAAASPSLDAELYLIREEGEPLAIRARGGVPSLQRALGDPELAEISAWQDGPGDAAWTSPAPADILRAMDRFHPVPDVARRADSWAEWLYFNGRTEHARFYLTFLVGPHTESGLRRAGVRLQLERNGRVVAYSAREEVDGTAVLAGAPDLRIGASRVQLEGMRYIIDLDLGSEEDGSPLAGRITLDAVAGRSLPPFEIEGAGGWVSGYTVPVLSGSLGGSLVVGDESIALDGGVGYHDHNWGFWEGVTWQWGQVAGEDLSLLYGRVFPPADAADPERVPGFLVALGPDGPQGFAADVEIEELDDGAGKPRRIVVRAEGVGVSLTIELQVVGSTVSRPGSWFGGGEFLQLQARYRVTGELGERVVDFTAPGAAETFRGR